MQTQHKLQLLEFCTSPHERKVNTIKAWEAPNLSCLEWRPPVDGSILAYGSTVGSVHLVNTDSCEEISVSQGTKLGRRPCNSVSWNKLMPSQLLAGFDNLKSECCAIVWDFEHEHFLQTSFGESACSVSWLPDNAHSVAVGTSMGWVKVYDTRTSNQLGASCSIMAHPAPRPRKIRGIRPDPFRPHLFATYSDFPGDVVKVWDLRKVSNPTSKTVVPPSFIVTPAVNAGGRSGSSGVSGSSFSSSSSYYTGGGVSIMSASEAEAIVDVAWSTARSGVLAIATAARKSISFYSTATASGTSSVPLFSVCVPEPVQVNGLAWQHTEASQALALWTKDTSHAQSSPLQADRKSIVASMTAAASSGFAPTTTTAFPASASTSAPSWESFRSEEELRMSAHSFVLIKASGDRNAAPATGGFSAGCKTGNHGHPRLLAATVCPLNNRSSGDAECKEGFAEVQVLDRIPLSISTAGGLLAVNTSRGRQVAISRKSVSQILCQQYQKVEESVCSLYKSTDVCDIMRLRCLAGYSADAYANFDVLAEELDAVYGDISFSGGSCTDELLRRTVENTKAVYRTWVWMDRFETTVTEAGLTVSNCGVQEVLLRNQLHISAPNVGKQFRSEVVHPTLGATVFGSEGRELGKKLCGWIKMFGLGRIECLAAATRDMSRNSSASFKSGNAISPKSGAASTGSTGFTGRAEWDVAADEGLLEAIVDEIFVDSFERAAAIALWHGRLDLAVAILRRAITQMESNSASSSSSSSSAAAGGEGSGAIAISMQKILWDAPCDPGYIQTVSLVAMCIAGYNFQHITKAADSGAHSTEGRTAEIAASAKQTAASQSQSALAASSASATWASMCLHVISQLLTSRRDATGYLSAACHFLLCNLEKENAIAGNSAGSCSDSSSSGGIDMVQLYAPIVDDRRLSLEDRVAFACTFLPDEAANKWLERTVEHCISTGSIEGLIVTGLSDAGISILQKYVDIYDDVQTVALLVSRVIDSQNGGSSGSTGSEVGAISRSSAGGADMPSKEWVWLHEYRSVLNKWEMFIERAYLDVELGKRYRRKAAMLAGASSAGGSGKMPQMPTVVKKGPPQKGQGGQSQQQKSKAGRVLYKLPVHSDYPHFYLRCGFCGASLPVDGMQNVRPEHLRLQNNVLHCCAACNKQLPRCYVCQLYMGMVNPYLELNRVMTQKRISADRLLASGDSIKGGGGPSSSGFGDDPAGSGSGSTAGSTGCKEIEHNSVSFGKWFFFCQHCRHGGHATCIDQWFGGTGAVSSSQAQESVGSPSLCVEVGAVKRRVCGVNGCDCRCVARL